MNPLISRLLIGFGILFAVFVWVKASFFAPNNEADSGLIAGTAASQQYTNPDELPSRLWIPKISVDTNVQHVGVTKTGNMAAPNGLEDVGWYKFGTAPGFKGSAVIAGHVDNALGKPAVFYDLNKLEVGDDIYIEQEDGERLHFVVERREIHPYNLSGEPLEQIYHADDASRLNLITCVGEWVKEARSAANRLVIYAVLAE